MAAEEKFSDVTVTKAVFLGAITMVVATLVMKGIEYAWNNIGNKGE